MTKREFVVELVGKYDEGHTLGFDEKSDAEKFVRLWRSRGAKAKLLDGAGRTIPVRRRP